MPIFINNCTVGNWYLIVVIVLTKDYWQHQGCDSYSCSISQCIQSPHITTVLNQNNCAM